MLLLREAACMPGSAGAAGSDEVRRHTCCWQADATGGLGSVWVTVDDMIALHAAIHSHADGVTPSCWQAPPEQDTVLRNTISCVMRAIDAVHAAYMPGPGPGAPPAKANRGEPRGPSRSRAARDSLLLPPQQVRSSCTNN